MNEQARTWVAGPDTLAGRALLRRLAEGGWRNVLRPSSEPDLNDPAAVDRFLAAAKPEFVFLAAGKTGGIRANQLRPAELMLDNLQVACNVIAGSHRHGVRKLLYLASSCSYPRLCPQPMREDALLTGPFEPTNDAYATAKVAGWKLCQAYRRQYGSRFIVGIPANLFGPGDDFDPAEAHVIPALLRKMTDARRQQAPAVTLWGTGRPRREFLFVDDLADACLFLMRHYDDEAPINIAGGTDLSIREVAEAVREVVGYEGELQFDPAMPDGMPLKALDASRIAALGWRPHTLFRSALSVTYEWFREYERTLEAV